MLQRKALLIARDCGSKFYCREFRLQSFQPSTLDDNCHLPAISSHIWGIWKPVLQICRKPFMPEPAIEAFLSSRASTKKAPHDTGSSSHDIGAKKPLKASVIKLCAGTPFNHQSLVVAVWRCLASGASNIPISPRGVSAISMSTSAISEMDYSAQGDTSFIDPILPVELREMSLRLLSSDVSFLGPGFALVPISVFAPGCGDVIGIIQLCPWSCPSISHA